MCKLLHRSKLNIFYKKSVLKISNLKMDAAAPRRQPASAARLGYSSDSLLRKEEPGLTDTSKLCLVA